MFQRFGLLLCALFFAGSAQASFLVRVGDVWQLYKARTEPGGPPGAWRLPGYASTNWFLATSGFSTYAGYFTEASVFPDYASDFLSFYMRKSFVVADTNTVRWLTLRVDYNDAFIAYLNGVEVARRNLPAGPVTYSTPASGLHVRGVPEQIDISTSRTNLVNGENVLAVQVHGQGPPLDYDFCLNAELLMNFTRGPVLQNASTNQMTIHWKTPFPSSAIVQYGTTPALEHSVTNLDLVDTHATVLTGLKPDTTYFYRAISTVNRDTASSPVETFRTLRMNGGFSFVVAGDVGQSSTYQYNIAQIMKSLQPDMAILVGDIIYPYFTANLADIRHFSIYEPMMKNIPIFCAPGNHDAYYNAVDFYNTLYLPTNRMTGTEHYYSFDHGDGHFVIVNSDMQGGPRYEVGSPQYQWLEADLAATTKPWKFMLFHHTLRTSSIHVVDDYDGNAEADTLQLQRTIGALAEKYGVIMNLQGHDHVYERFNPVRGLYTITSGGGGAGLYPFARFEPDSSQFVPIHHCVKVTVEGGMLQLQAVDFTGRVFDTMTIHRSVPTNNFSAVWDSPSIESKPADDGDGNVVGQRFHFSTNAIPTVTGKNANLGQVYVSNDRRNLYIGFEQTMIASDANIFLFVESPRLKGVDKMISVGNGMVDPDGQGADGLDFVANLSFSNFSPAIGCILGDELADSQYRSFSRPTLSLNAGQGVYYLNTNLTDVPGARFAQFNRSPQAGVVPNEQNANFIELSIPLASLGFVRPGDSIKLGAVVGRGGVNTNKTVRARELDNAFLGKDLIGAGLGAVLLEGVTVKLASDPDPLSIKLDVAKLATPGRFQLMWNALAGKSYVVQAASDPRGPFVDLTGPNLPLRAGANDSELTYELVLPAPQPRAQFIRIRVIP